MIDVKTKNKSFLKTAIDLKAKGVKNNKFFLELKDPDLQGVDPYSKTLTAMQQIKIYTEICNNKWYFLREVVRIPVAGDTNGIQYVLNAGNLSLSFMKSKNINMFVMLMRQAGKTIGNICDDLWALEFATTNTNATYMNKELKDSKLALSRYGGIKEILPLWLRNLIIDKKDTNNIEYKRIEHRKNTLTAKPGATSDTAADKLGRGLSTSLLYFDEFAFLERNQIIFEACMPAWSKAASIAKVNGVPYGITITTTPNNLDLAAAKYAKDLKDNAAPFRYECFDMSDEELRTYLDGNSKNGFISIEFSYKDLGYDDKWLSDITKGLSLGKIKREYLLEWPLADDNMIFSEEEITNIYEYVKDPMTNIKVKSFFVDFYEMPDFNTNYIISCDIAGGLSQDSTAILIISPDDFRIVGDFNSNTINTEDTKEIITMLMMLYFRNAVLIIERNSYGLPIIQSLIKNSSIERRMVKELKEQKGERKEQNGRVVKKTMKSFEYGVTTTSKSRALMFDMLPNIVANDYDKIISKKLYQDIASLVRTGTGRVEARQGSHDDNIMAYLIFMYALHFGTSLKDKFGIKPFSTKSNVKVVSSPGMQRKMAALILRNANDPSSDVLMSTGFANDISIHQQKIQKNDDLGSSSPFSLLNAFNQW